MPVHIPARSLPLSALQECFCYHRETGKFSWLARPREHFKTDAAHLTFIHRYAGTEAFATADPTGRFLGSFRYEGRRYRLHRSWAVWAFEYGVWPTGELHHRNDVLGDDRIENLQEITSSQRRILTPSRKAIGRGVILRPNGKYEGYIRPNGRNVYLGRFETVEEARAAFSAAAEEHFGEFGRLACDRAGAATGRSAA